MLILKYHAKQGSGYLNFILFQTIYKCSNSIISFRTNICNFQSNFYIIFFTFIYKKNNFLYQYQSYSFIFCYHYEYFLQSNQLNIYTII